MTLLNSYVFANDFSSGDPYWAGTHLLLAADLSNADSSYYKQATAATQSNTTWSTTNGKYGGCIQIAEGGWIKANNGFNPKYYAFTAEGWFYLDPAGAGINRSMLRLAYTTASPRSGLHVFYQASDQTVQVRAGDGSETAWEVIGGSDTVTPFTSGTWHHIAVQREQSGAKLSLFINGVKQPDIPGLTGGMSIADGSWYIGAPFTTGTDAAISSWLGSVDDIRITKGVARYRSAFNSPTTAFTTSGDTYAANTVLLAHFDGVNNQTGVLIDESVASTTLRTYGNAMLSTAQTYFGTTSLYLDGAAYVKPDYPSGSGPSYDLGVISTSTNFTAEFFFKPAVVDSNYRVLMAHALPGSGGNGIGGWSIYTQSNGKLAFQVSKNSSAGTGWFAQYQTDDAVLTSTSTWYYIAVMIRNGVPRIFVNGIERASSFLTTNSAYATSIIGFDTTKTNYGLIIGALDSDSTNTVIQHHTNGYIDELRITMGVARYTGAFTPAKCLTTGPADPNWSLVSLVIPGSLYNEKQGVVNASNWFTDCSSYSHVLNRVSSWEDRSDDPIIGNSSMGIVGAFPSSGRLEFNSHPSFDLSGQDFTMESWVNPSSGWSATYLSRHGSNDVDGKPAAGWSFGWNATNTNLFFGWRFGSTWTLLATASASMPAGVWYHVAALVRGSTLELRINGQVSATTTFAGITDSATKLWVGEGWNPAGGTGNSFKLMNYVRLTQGVARYNGTTTIYPIPFPLR